MKEWGCDNMITRTQYENVVNKAIKYLENAKIAITEEEKSRIEVADFGLGKLETFGLSLLTYVNTQRCCSKELILLSHQACPEHIHPPVNGGPGKEETFRCRWGDVYLYVEGDPVKEPKAQIPKEKEKEFTVWHEIVLKPGQQYTLHPNIKHWFQAGSEGAIVSEFSTMSLDETDIFTDKSIQRITEIEE